MAILLSDSYKVINWDLNTKSLDTKYWGKVTDSGRGCKVALLQNGVLSTPSTETMRVNFKKPSGLQIFLDGVISGNYFVFDFTEQVFAEQGEVMAELMINVGGEWLMSSTFYIQVDQSFTSALESSEELTALQTALTNVDNFKTKILDVNGNEILKFSAIPNAVNEVIVYNNITGQEPGINSSGNDTNIAFGIHTKGLGYFNVYVGALNAFAVKASANAVNYLRVEATPTNVAPSLQVIGTDANIDITLSPKGTGGVVETRVNFTEATTLANITSGESNTTLWGKVKKMFSFIGTTTLTTTAQTITTAINELVTKTTLTDITSSITLNSAFTLLNKRATLVGKRVTLQIIASPNIATGANTLHNLGSVSSAYKPSTIDCNTCGCLQDGSFLFQNGALVVIKADTGAINVSSNIALTSKYIQFSVTYDIA